MLLILLGTIAVAWGILVFVSNISGRLLNYNYFQTSHMNAHTPINVLHEFTDFEKLLSIEHYNEVIDQLAMENESFYKYDEEFFEQKSIILVEHGLANGSVEYELKDIIRSGNEITVNFYSVSTDPVSPDVWRGIAIFFIEVYKNDIIDSTVNVNVSWPD